MGLYWPKYTQMAHIKFINTIQHLFKYNTNLYSNTIYNNYTIKLLSHYHCKLQDKSVSNYVGTISL